jgi:hypothetical protein
VGRGLSGQVPEGGLQVGATVQSPRQVSAIRRQNLTAGPLHFWTLCQAAGALQ